MLILIPTESFVYIVVIVAVVFGTLLFFIYLFIFFPFFLQERDTIFTNAKSNTNFYFYLLK